MTINFTKNFRKQYAKIPNKIQLQFDDRLQLFLSDPTNAKLRVHPLKGSYIGYWSMNVSGDFRALYRMDGDEVVLFALIGTHSQLYG